MIRLTSFLTRNNTFSHEEFINYWFNEHAPIAQELPGLRKYCVGRPLTPKESNFDGVAELYFDTLSEFNNVLGPDAETEAMADVDRFISNTDRHLVNETVHHNELPSSGNKISELYVLTRRSKIEQTQFTNALAEIVNCCTSSSEVGLCTTATPITKSEMYDTILKLSFDSKHTYDQYYPDAESTLFDRYPELSTVSESTISFVGEETTFLDTL
ncbi:EthD family reductase [Natrialbaceae archaeon A-CW2]